MKFISAVALVMNALDPTILAVQGSRFGSTSLQVDLYGDALAAAVLPGDRWRSANDAPKYQVYLGARYLGIFNRYFSAEGRGTYGCLNHKRSGRRPSFLASS
jgi:hypothetical protein